MVLTFSVEARGERMSLVRGGNRDRVLFTD